MRGRMAPRCGACGLLEPLCLCGLREPVVTSTQVIAILHPLEARKPTSTSRLLPLALGRGACRIHGERGVAPNDTRDLVTPTHQTWILFPSEDAIEIDAELLAADARPIRLVVPDGTWSQGGKLARRMREITRPSLPCVKLSGVPPSRYRLRRTERTHGLCTYEAAVEVLARVEGEAVREPLLEWLEVFVDRTLWSRGALPASKVRGGITREMSTWRSPGR